MKDMKDPIQGTLDAVREVEIRIGQVRILWSEAVAVKEAAEAEALRLREDSDRNIANWQRVHDQQCESWQRLLDGTREELAKAKEELQQSRLLSARAQAEAFECRKEMERLRADYENGMRRDVEVTRQLEQFRTRRHELEDAHAAIWGLGCALTGAYADAKSARHARNRLRRSNDRVREVLGAKPGESPVEAAERVNQSRHNVEYMGREVERLRAERDSAKAIMGQEIERFRNDRDAALARVVKLEKACKEGEQAARALQESWNAVYANRDKALARVEELEREVASLRSPALIGTGIHSLNPCCCAARQVVRNECAASLFKVFQNGETLDTAFYGFDAALAVVTKELSELRKDRETLNRVRGAVEGKS